jgi:acyl CoA:acetate/3-ketoacid CoA transferase beta subunit
MDAQTLIAKRIALELRDGMPVNLGIGIPTLVANFVPQDMHVVFRALTDTASCAGSSAPAGAPDRKYDPQAVNECDQIANQSKDGQQR